MKITSGRYQTRRDVFRLLGGAALALPTLEILSNEARGQTSGKKSKFAVFCYTPNGVNEKAFWPTGTESNFTLSSVLAPFAPFKDKMLILGPQMNAGVPKPGTGLAYGGETHQHQAPVCLTGRKAQLPYQGQTSAVNNIDGPSVDQVIGAATKGDSPFSSLNFGMHSVGGDTPSDINYAPSGTPLKRMMSAEEAWTRVFGMVMPQSGSEPAAPSYKHTAVSNFLHARFAALKSELGAHDREVMDAHLASLRTFEERKKRMLSAPSGCTPPPRGDVPADETSIRTGSDTEKLSPFMMDIIASAFSCNLTKVATVSFGYPGGGDAGGLRMPWLGFTDALHGVSHHGNNPDMLSKYTKMNTWVASQVAYLMQKLAAIGDGSGGTLLDQTTIYWFNRHGEGNTHANYALPNIILGGTGGYFKTGRYLQMPATSPTKVLISLANAMGVDLPTFGSGNLIATSPLAGLTA